VNAESYRTVGGHEAIKNSPINDVHLAQLAKSNNIPYQFLLGQEMGNQRWYTSFRKIWQTWSGYTFLSMDYQISEAIKSILSPSRKRHIYRYYNQLSVTWSYREEFMED